MIISMLQGGIGNQMFQYAAGLALANKYNTILKVDMNYLLDKTKKYFKFSQRSYALDVFNNIINIALPDDIARFTVPRIGNKYVYHLKKRFKNNFNYFNEENIQSLDDFFSIPADAYIIGYWQNVNYIKNIRNLLLKEFCFKDPLPNHYGEILNKIHNSNSVCIHFRRQDYAKHPELDIIDLNYYHSSINIYKNLFNDLKYFIFSDDILWCKHNFIRNDIDMVFVDQNKSDIEMHYDLQLMIACKKYIIPNSTYSWWAAWLNNDQDKSVVAPKKWFKSQTIETNPIVPRDWISL